MANTEKKKPGAPAAAAPAGKKQGGKFTLTDGNRKILFAALAIIALGVIAYAFLSAAPADPVSSDGSEFYHLLVSSPTSAILYDVRGVGSDAQQSAIYQCGVDMIYNGRFVGKTVSNIACDAKSCIYTTSGTNMTNYMSYDQAIKTLSGTPYILIKPGGASGYMFFQHHMEIYIAANATGTGAKCDLSATEG